MAGRAYIMVKGRIAYDGDRTGDTGKQRDPDQISGSLKYDLGGVGYEKNRSAVCDSVIAMVWRFPLWYGPSSGLSGSSCFIHCPDPQSQTETNGSWARDSQQTRQTHREASSEGRWSSSRRTASSSLKWRYRRRRSTSWRAASISFSGAGSNIVKPLQDLAKQY